MPRVSQYLEPNVRTSLNRQSLRRSCVIDACVGIIADTSASLFELEGTTGELVIENGVRKYKNDAIDEDAENEDDQGEEDPNQGSDQPAAMEEIDLCWVSGEQPIDTRTVGGPLNAFHGHRSIRIARE
ncbi:hypothetical protein MBANPS3_012461 [Mucor bainieri]